MAGKKNRGKNNGRNTSSSAPAKSSIVTISEEDAAL